MVLALVGIVKFLRIHGWKLVTQREDHAKQGMVARV